MMQQPDYWKLAPTLTFSLGVMLFGLDISPRRKGLWVVRGFRLNRQVSSDGEGAAWVFSGVGGAVSSRKQHR